MNHRIKKQLIIVLDESTSMNKNGLGPSLCFWVAYVYIPSEDKHITSSKISEESRYEVAVLMKSAGLKPVRSGAIYNDIDTPIKISLDGIARALQSCSYLLSKYSVNEVILCGDCENAIKLAKGEKPRRAKSIVSLGKTIDSLAEEYKSKNVNVFFRCISESDFALYKDIDAMCKQVRSQLTKNF